MKFGREVFTVKTAARPRMYGLPHRVASLIICLATVITAVPAHTGEAAAPSGGSGSTPAPTSAILQSLQRVVGRNARGRAAPQVPAGLLMDAAPTVSDTAHVPASLANPLTVARVQSAYRAADAVSGTLVVTFTVFNNLSPATTSSLPVSTTGTSALSSTLDLAHDPHTIHNVLLTDGLVGLAAYVDAAPEPDRHDTQSAWNLGDIQPLQSATVVLTLTVPATGTDFSTLDTGASVWGTLEGRAVTAQARPAGFAPDNVSDGPTGDWLRSTVDANITDQYMLNQTGIFTQDPLLEFSYVQGLGYESYKGSLRGTRGTLWSQAGNSLDKSSLLIAMLRASGIPSRYRHGTLSTPLAQQLILSMFPTPTHLVGHIPAGTPLADPAHDPKLLSETQDHWWVEVYLPGTGWQDLDPSFTSATEGQRFVRARQETK